MKTFRVLINLSCFYWL